MRCSAGHASQFHLKDFYYIDDDQGKVVHHGLVNYRDVILPNSLYTKTLPFLSKKCGPLLRGLQIFIQQKHSSTLQFMRTY